jgi:hypothetical protein
MITVDKTQDLASDHGEFWAHETESPERVFVDMSLTEDNSVEFSYSVDGENFILAVPVERLKRLLR